MSSYKQMEYIIINSWTVGVDNLQYFQREHTIMDTHDLLLALLGKDILHAADILLP